MSGPASADTINLKYAADGRSRRGLVRLRAPPAGPRPLPSQAGEGRSCPVSGPSLKKGGKQAGLRSSGHLKPAPEASRPSAARARQRSAP